MKQLTILVAPINAVGHVTACIGTTSALVHRGHRVIFVLENAWKGKLIHHDIEEYLFSAPSQAGKQTADMLAQQFHDRGMFSDLAPIEKTRNFQAFLESPYIREEHVYYNQALKEAIEQLKPDVILSDESGLMPAIYYSNIPWIRHISFNPLFFIKHKDLPPGGSGLPMNDRTDWEEYNRVRHFQFHSKYFNDFVESLGYPRYPNEVRTPESQILTVYACPDEWNYSTLRERSDWFNIEVFHKNESNIVNSVDLSDLVPKEFLADSLDGKFSGKFIYVSMGSMGSIDLKLMNRLVEVLSKTTHKYIFSKGPLHEQIHLERNQWGDRFLPQTALIPQMDLIITHGGNNSVTEIYAQGKPMIVLPLFHDQYDNAQRLHETGYAVRLDTYKFTDHELVGSIDRLVEDRELKRKLETASKRIQSADKHNELAALIEQLLVQ